MGTVYRPHCAWTPEAEVQHPHAAHDRNGAEHGHDARHDTGRRLALAVIHDVQHPEEIVPSATSGAGARPARRCQDAGRASSAASRRSPRATRAGRGHALPSAPRARATAPRSADRCRRSSCARAGESFRRERRQLLAVRGIDQDSATGRRQLVDRRAQHGQRVQRDERDFRIAAGELRDRHDSRRAPIGVRRLRTSGSP